MMTIIVILTGVAWFIAAALILAIALAWLFAIEEHINSFTNEALADEWGKHIKSCSRCERAEFYSSIGGYPPDWWSECCPKWMSLWGEWYVSREVNCAGMKGTTR